MRKIIITALIFFQLSTTLFAQTTSSTISEILSAMPAQNKQQLQKSMEAITALGEKGIIEMIAMLSPAGKTDNTSLEYAIGGYSYYVIQTGKETERQMAVNAYCSALKKLSDNASKQFIIKQLQQMGNDAAVPSIAKYLHDEYLSAPAAEALAQINSPASTKALLKALKNSQGAVQLSLIEALGYAKYNKAVPAISKIATTDQGELRKVCLYALARIGNPASTDLLQAAAQKAGYTLENTDATAAYVTFLNELAANGNKETAEKFAMKLLADANAVQQVHTKTAALKLLVDIQKEKSLPVLNTAMQDADIKYRSAAIGFAAQFQGQSLNKKDISASPIFLLSEEEKKDGFKVLFDGSNLDLWTGNTIDYTVNNGDILIDPKDQGHGNLYTKQEFSNFIYRFEFQLTPGANNGLGIRAPLEGDAAYAGMEIQILDNEADMYKDLHPYQYHGSVYGVIPAKRGFLKPTGEWNYEEVIANGNKIKVVLNNEVILDGDISEAIKNGTMDHNQHPGLLRQSGHIGFLGHGSVVRFRNIRVKEL